MLKYYLLTFLGLLLFSSPIKLSAQTIYIQEDFNSGSLPTGWSNSALSGSNRWQFGNDGSSLHSGNNSIDSSNFVYFDDDNLGSTSTNNNVQLSTPIFNNSSNKASFLEFDYNFRDYDLTNTNDSFYVEVFDGVNWNWVYGVTIDDCGRYTGPFTTNCESLGFPRAVIDITAFANSNCIVRFIYFDGNDWSWYAGIDNLFIYSPEPNDIGVISIENPKTTSCKLLKNELISCTIENFSADTINSFEIIAKVDSGNQQVIDTVNTTLLPFDSMQYTFIKGVDLSLSKAYFITVATNFSLDANSSNDSSKVLIPTRSIKTLPYVEGFESTNHEWTVSGDSMSWERGTPNNNFIKSAAKGNNAFVTKLNENYFPNETSYLTSPCILLDSINRKYLLSVDLTFDTEGGFDQLFLEYSYDGGNTWQKLNKSLPDFSWYNLSSTKTWSGKKNNWKNYSTTFLGQSTTIKFRFIFKSDTYNQFEGVGVDNFSVRPVYSTDLRFVKLLSPPEKSSNLCGLSTSEEVSVKLLSYGHNNVDTFKLAYQIDNANPINVQPSLVVNKNTSLSYSFQTNANLLERKTHTLTTFLEFLNEGVWQYDTMVNYINNEYYLQKDLPYFEDFDGMTPISNFINSSNFSDSLSVNWNRSPNFSNIKEYMWVVAKDSAFDGRTGPIMDNTGKGGNYLLFTTVSPGSCCIQEASITSPCISVSSGNPKLSFWFHRHSVSQPLFIDIFKDDSLYNAFDTISLSVPANNTDSFVQANIDLSAFISSKIKLRFRSNISIFPSTMAIDDIYVYDSSVVTGIEPIELGKNKFTLYPNPNQGEFTLSANKELIGSEFEVYNLSGQLLRRKLLQQKSIQLNLSEFGKGIYFIRFPQLNLTKKLVVY